MLIKNMSVMFVKNYFLYIGKFCMHVRYLIDVNHTKIFLLIIFFVNLFIFYKKIFKWIGKKENTKNKNFKVIIYLSSSTT